MMAQDRDALLCDLAETYRIYDFKALPVSVLATLSVGLRDDSRIKMQLAGVRASRLEILLAAAVDNLSVLVWSRTEDGQKGRNRPASVLAQILGIVDDNSEVTAYSCGEEFETAWKSITEEVTTS